MIHIKLRLINFTSILIVSLTITLYSCTNIGEKYQKFLEVPLVLNLDKMIKVDSDTCETLQNKLHHIIIIDSVQCSKCLVNKWVMWQAFENKATDLSPEYALTIIVNGGDSTIVKRIQKVKRYGAYKSSVLIDTNQTFKHSNPIIDQSSAFNSILLNDSNKIIAFGDPSINSEIEEIWLKTIKEYK